MRDATDRGHFLRQIVADDVANGRHVRIVTRFPPEPNGYLHIGHCKSICLNFGLASEFGGVTNLRMDDTNPLKEDEEYVEGIAEDVAWLGFSWAGSFHASDYFEQMYLWAEHLVVAGHAYVCHQTEEEMRAGRGTVTVHGTSSPFRNRPASESLDLLRRMRAGEFPDGAATLRARADMASPNMKMRDPPLYRIRHARHHRTGDTWCVYPMYDYAHPLSDAIEGVTHSVCTLEFENNRELYDWVIAHCPVPHKPRQYEFARLSLQSTMMSKRRLLNLVQEGLVTGWDDPRMPTIAGLRRRGVRANALREFAERVGVARAANLVSMDLLDTAIREDLEPFARRGLAVLRPLPIEVVNWPENEVQAFETPWGPEGFDNGSRTIPFGRQVFIEREDFQAEPEEGFRRLAPGRTVRLRHAFVITCTDVLYDEAGNVSGLRATADLSSRGAPAKASATLHWVCAARAVRLQTRLFERLFSVDRPDAEPDFRTVLNPKSRTDIEAWAEPALLSLAPGDHVQLERLGFFFCDPTDSRTGAPVLNRVTTLRDSFPKSVVRAPPPPASAPIVAVKAKAPDPLAQPWLDRGVGDEEGRVLAHDPNLAALFEEAFATFADAQSLGAFLVHHARSALKDGVLLNTHRVGTIAKRLAQNVINGRGADVLLRSEGDVDADIDALNLRIITDEGALWAFVLASFAAFPDKEAALRSGKTGLQGFFVGDVMKRSDGRAHAATVSRLMIQLISR